MSRRRGNGNDIRGPTSALTAFLKEHNITTESISRRAATRNRSNLSEEVPRDEPEAGPAPVEEEAMDEAARPGPSRRTRSRVNNEDDDEAEVNSDQLDDSDGEREPGPSSRKKPKMSKAAEAKAKAAAKAKAKAKAKKGKDDDDYGGGSSTDEDEEAYTAPSRGARRLAGAAKPPNGSFEKCARCEQQFTVTQYTMAATPGPGFLCHKCAKEGGADPFKKPSAPRKRKAPAPKRDVTYFEERRLPTLASLCVKAISSHIDDVEALGDLGSVNIDNIIRSLSRIRSLTPENATLFYGARNKSLTLYDATNLTTPALCSLGMLNPNLTSLRLDFCGRLTDPVLEAWSTSLPNLTHLDLHGPYLAHPHAWIAFFKSHPKLEAFQIFQSPRFDLASVEALCTSCPNLTTLRLKEVGQLSDAFLAHIGTLACLTALDLADPAASCSEEALSELINTVGASLRLLDLSGHTDLTDAFLSGPLAAHGRALESLALANLPELTDAGTAALFEAWRDGGAAPPLSALNLARDGELGDAALTALLAAAGPTLTQLDIGGWRGTTGDALGAIGARAGELRVLDVGFNRAVDDYVVKAVFDGCAKLEEVRCWGCNRVTVNCPRRRGVAVHGIESLSSV